MSHGGRGVKKVLKKCHVLFEWPLTYRESQDEKCWFITTFIVHYEAWSDKKRWFNPVLNKIGMKTSTFITDIILKPVTLTNLEKKLILFYARIQSLNWQNLVNNIKTSITFIICVNFLKSNIVEESLYTVKPVYNDHPRDPKFVAVVDRWSLFRGRFMLWSLKLGLQNGGRCRQVVAIRRWSLTQVWLYLKYQINKVL